MLSIIGCTILNSLIMAWQHWKKATHFPQCKYTLHTANVYGGGAELNLLAVLEYELYIIQCTVLLINQMLTVSQQWIL